MHASFSLAVVLLPLSSGLAFPSFDRCYPNTREEEETLGPVFALDREKPEDTLFSLSLSPLSVRTCKKTSSCTWEKWKKGL